MDKPFERSWHQSDLHKLIRLAEKQWAKSGSVDKWVLSKISELKADLRQA